VYAVAWAAQMLWLTDRLSAIAALTPDRDSDEARQAGPAQTQGVDR